MSDFVVQVQKVYELPGSTVGAYQLKGQPLTYSYGSPLRVGDRVVCPAHEYSPAFIAEVVALGSDYDGPLRSLLCRVAPDRKRT